MMIEMLLRVVIYRDRMFGSLKIPVTGKLNGCCCGCGVGCRAFSSFCDGIYISMILSRAHLFKIIVI